MSHDETLLPGQAPGGPSPADQGAAPAPAPPLLSPPPDRQESPGGAPGVVGMGGMVGHYKIIRAIGEGGFGTVYLAEQQRPVVRQVALKIIKLGMDTRQVVARFEQERQALAMMDHPNIAKVFDAGATDMGRPYFVMEYCAGEPIDAFCDRERLGIRERLELFVQVCDAVQHAHTKAIIHRDIKPSNVLVRRQDDRLAVKVIDFGIAKATAAKLTEKTLFTEHKQFIGTPEYMSPEQAEGSLDIDTRTDVYSLGVLLYELLTGSTPFSGRDLRSAGFAEILRIIREVDPPRPSTRISASADTIAAIASRRRVEPRRLGTIVRGELDWIVMTAMEKDRARRYETASALALDLRRYLDGDSVLAVPPSAMYRLRKFARRNRVAVGTASAVAAALLVGLIAFAWQAQIARQQRDLAQEAKKTADEQLDRAIAAEAQTALRAAELEQVSEFQSDMLAQVDPTQAGVLLAQNILAKLEASLTKEGAPAQARRQEVEAFEQSLSRVNATDLARELIDQTILTPAVAALNAGFADQPAIDARLRQVLASRYLDFGMYEASLPLQQAALQTRQALHGADHEDTLESLSNLATLLHYQGQLQEAEKHYVAALEGYRRVNGNDDPDTLISMGKLGSLLFAQGRMQEAEPYLREALEGHRRVLGEEHQETLLSINNMGFLMQAQGRLADAEPFYREALEKSRRILGDDHPNTLVSINNMGYLLQAQRKFDEAEPYWQESLDRRRRVLGETHPDTLNALNNMGSLRQQQGRAAEAEPFWLEALEKRRQLLGPEHPDTLWSMNNLGGLYLITGRPDEAQDLLTGAYQGRRKVMGPDHPDTLISAVNLGALLVSQEKFGEARALLEPLEPAIRQRFTGSNPVRVISLLLHLGRARAGPGYDAEQFPLAEANLLEAHRMLAALMGDSHAESRRVAQELSSLYTAGHAAQPSGGYDAKAEEWAKKAADPS